MSVKQSLVELLVIVLGDKDHRIPGYLPRVIDGVPHLRECRIGEAVDGYGAPDYAPCSSLCVVVREACVRALDAIGAPAVPQETRTDGSLPAGRAARRGVLPMSRRARSAPGRALPSSPARRSSAEAAS